MIFSQSLQHESSVKYRSLKFGPIWNKDLFYFFQQIKKVPVGLIRGFQSLRPQLKTLICRKSVISLNVSTKI